MNRILPVLMIAIAAWLHVTYCEWDFRDDLKSVGQSQYSRTIFHQSTPHHGRRRRTTENIFLLAREPHTLNESKRYGVLFPLALAGFGVSVLYLTRGE